MSRPEEPGFNFEWVEGDDELTPETEALLRELSVPIEHVPVRKLSEIVHEDLVTEVRTRLEALRVEGYERVDKSLIKNNPELQMTPYILDDVHYLVYRARKQGAFNRFVSVSIEDIAAEFARLRDHGTTGTLLQREQNAQAVNTLINAGKVEEGSIYEKMVGSEGRFAVRCMCRLLKEDSMVPFTNAMAKATRRRMDEAPLTFDEIAYHAPHFIGNKLDRHNSFNPSGLSTVQRMTYDIVGHDLRRANAFATPIVDYMSRHTPTEQS